MAEMELEGHAYNAYGKPRRTFRYDDPGARQFTQSALTHYNMTFKHQDAKFQLERRPFPNGEKPKICPTKMKVAGQVADPTKPRFDLAGHPLRGYVFNISLRSNVGTSLIVAGALKSWGREIPQMTGYQPSNVPMDHPENRAVTPKPNAYRPVNKLMQSSASIIGSHFKPEMVNAPPAMNNGRPTTSYHMSRKPDTQEFAGIEVEQLYPVADRVRKNDRTMWNRNASNVGRVAFNAKEAPTLHKNGRHRVYSARQDKGLFVPTTTEENLRVTSKAKHTDHYKSEYIINHMGYNMRMKRVDDTTVSGDAPTWMQVPGVNVNKLSSHQLGHLVAWNAPIPKAHVDPQLLLAFEGSEDIRPAVHPELEHLPSNMKAPLMSYNDSERKLKETYDACAQRILAQKKPAVDHFPRKQKTKSRSTSAPPTRNHFQGQKPAIERTSHPVWSSRGPRAAQHQPGRGGYVPAPTSSFRSSVTSLAGSSRKGWC